MRLLEGKNIVITGASRGIGKGIANLFALQGANIAFTYQSSVEEARSLEKVLKTTNIKIKGYKSDASDFKAAQRLIDDVLNDFETIDVLINNAGITKDNLLMRMSEKDFDDVMSINMKSVFNLTKSVVRQMLKQKKGSIINMSSIVGVEGNAGQSNYSASKSAIIGFTKSVALELGSRNIRCNAIAPGFIETEMTKNLDENILNKWKEKIPLKRVGTTEDIANTALFLACDMSSYITGQVLKVCGGVVT